MPNFMPDPFWWPFHGCRSGRDVDLVTVVQAFGEAAVLVALHGAEGQELVDEVVPVGAPLERVLDLAHGRGEQVAATAEARLGQRLVPDLLDELGAVVLR